MMKKAEELRGQSIDELMSYSSDLAREIYELRCERRVGGQVEKPHLLKAKKRERARVLTILAEVRRGSALTTGVEGESRS